MNRREFLTRLIAATAVLPLARRLAPGEGTLPDLNFVDLPRETGNITALVPHNGTLLAFTERAVYRIDAVGGPYRFDGRRFRATWMDFNHTTVTKQRYL